MPTGSFAAGSSGCFCGAVKLRLHANPKGFINCHCSECRRLSGGAFTTWGAFAEEAVTIEGRQALTAFDVTANARRHFCSICGSHVYTSDKRHPHLLGIPAGVLAGTMDCKPSAHYFFSHRAAWNEVNDAIPKFGGESGRVRTDA